MSFLTTIDPNIIRSGLHNINQPTSYHLAFDGYVTDRGKLMDQSLLENLLASINLLIFDGTGTVRINSVDNTLASDWMDRGLLGYIVNAGEHFALRTSPNYGMFIADLCTAEKYPCDTVVNILLKAYRPYRHSLCRDVAPPRSKYGKHVAYISEVPVDHPHARKIIDAIKAGLKVHQIGEEIIIDYSAEGNEGQYDIFVPLREGFIAMHPYSRGTVLMLFLRCGFDASFVRRAFSADKCYTIQHSAPQDSVDVNTGFDTDELVRSQRRSNQEYYADPRRSSQQCARPKTAMGGGVK